MTTSDDTDDSPRTVAGESISGGKSIEAGCSENVPGVYGKYGSGVCIQSISNKSFLVPKSSGPNGEKKYRLINSCTRMNGVTLKDANIPPSADDFAKEYSRMAVTSVIDLFSGYDQIPLDAHSRDMTEFQSPLVLIRQMTLIQGWAGAVPVFCMIADLVTTDAKDEVLLPPEPGEDHEFGNLRFQDWKDELRRHMLMISQ